MSPFVQQITFGTRHSEIQKSFLIKDNRLRLKEAVQEWLVKDASEGNLNAFKTLQEKSDVTIDSVSDPCNWCGDSNAK
jgi:hypothetical protein